MKYPQVDSSDARLLVRSMGLLLSQASVYGPVHNVTKSATNRVYEEINQNLERYSTLEFTVKSNLVCVNGSSNDLDSSVSANLVRRFAQLDISGLLLRKPMPAREFEKVIRVLAMPVAQVAEASGVAALFEREEILSASVVKVAYKRVDHSDEDGVHDDEIFKIVADFAEGTSTVADSGVFDLSAELLGSDSTFASSEFDGYSDRYVAALQEREKQSARLAGLLRKTAESLENNSIDNPKVELGRVAGALELVRSALLEISVGAEKTISSFVQDVKDDKVAVAGLEDEARRRGYHLKLTREELLEQYAEINQAIIQPLTVTTGVIEMFRKEQAGILSGVQHDLLAMAHESCIRVHQLVEQLHGISGLPDSYTPDLSLLNGRATDKA